MDNWKTTIEPGLITDFKNYKHSFIVSFQSPDNKKREYRKEHKRRMSQKQFNAFMELLQSYEFISDRFKVLELEGFTKEAI